uniref:Secreted protein n=1 Tax=Eutreptiella gymnastica TaxID=73025 RepID=A0A7S1JCI7_9EUGL
MTTVGCWLVSVVVGCCWLSVSMPLGSIFSLEGEGEREGRCTCICSCAPLQVLRIHPARATALTPDVKVLARGDIQSHRRGWGEEGGEGRAISGQWAGPQIPPT